MPSRLVYDLLYKVGAARTSRGWDRGPGTELQKLVASGILTPARLGGDLAADLGCGTGSSSLFLARHGFRVTGIDFSEVAIKSARAEASAGGLTERTRFVVGDLTAEHIAGVEGTFDLVVAYNTLQDLRGADRRRMAALMVRLCRPGGSALVWCYFVAKKSLSLVSFRGPSRLAPFVIEPGEERELFEQEFEIARLPEPPLDSGFACFLMTRR